MLKNQIRKTKFIWLLWTSNGHQKWVLHWKKKCLKSKLSKNERFRHFLMNRLKLERRSNKKHDEKPSWRHTLNSLLMICSRAFVCQASGLLGSVSVAFSTHLKKYSKPYKTGNNRKKLNTRSTLNILVIFCWNFL